MTEAFAEFDADNGIATLVLNRPEAMNSIDVPMAQAIQNAVAEIAEANPRVVIMRGNGRAFVAGGDLKSFAEDFAAAATVVDAMLDGLHPAITTLANLAAPKIAAVHGAVAGAGLSLMAGCDFILAANGTRFLTAYDRIGASMDCGGSWYLPRRIGRIAATRLMLLSETWDVDMAMRAGLIDEVCAEEELLDTANDLAIKLAQRPTAAFSAWRKLLDRAETNPLSEHLEVERSSFLDATKTEDFVEGVSAFLEKRDPVFKGK